MPRTLNGRKSHLDNLNVNFEEKRQALVEGIKEIRKYTSGMRFKASQVIVIHLMGNHIAARDDYEEIAADILELKNQQLVERVRRAGAQVVSWNPLQHGFEKLLFAGLILCS